ncbi:uncharacterized protein G2W53_043361 [Senna tora]|uniref:Uncharacterized protein n=1 Tax=Senna tora TaxID=362788 RepID=A0A834SGW8_9FABA|nr:uncharacterized protein G2W53_043361 [Senna tora]
MPNLVPLKAKSERSGNEPGQVNLEMNNKYERTAGHGGTITITRKQHLVGIRTTRH